MDGEISSMDESVIRGCHPWMSSIDGEMSSMDGSVIRGCHPLMTLPSMDEDDG